MGVIFICKSLIISLITCIKLHGHDLAITQNAFKNKIHTAIPLKSATINHHDLLLKGDSFRFQFTITM